VTVIKFWINLFDFLGNNSRAPKNYSYAQFEEAKLYIKKLKLKSINDWYSYLKSGEKPLFIPNHPERVYRNMGWNGISDFLGYESSRSKSIKYLDFEEAKHFVKKLNLNSVKEWNLFTKSKKRPLNLPTDPRTYYLTEWKNWYDFLGKYSFKDVHFTYNEAKKYVQKLNIKTEKEFRNFIKTGEKDKKLPNNPSLYYKDEWKGIGDFLGTGNKSKKLFISFLDLKKIAKSNSIKSQKEWYNFYKSKNKLTNIPYHPQRAYSKEWKGWADFLGK